MAGVLEAKFAQMTIGATCPKVFIDWLAKQGITSVEIYGRLASTEDKLDTKVVERQLVASGLVQAVQASRAGFSDHLPPAHLVAQVTTY